MNKYIFLIFMLFVNDILFGQEIEGYSFDNYKVLDSIPKGKAAIDYSSNPTAKFMRTAILNGYNSGKVNFAGYYITIIWGCGTGCILGAMVDVRDGKVYDLPLGEEKAYYGVYSEDEDEKDRLLYKTKSRLFITSPRLRRTYQQLLSSLPPTYKTQMCFVFYGLKKCFGKYFPKLFTLDKHSCKHTLNHF